MEIYLAKIIMRIFITTVLLLCIINSCSSRKEHQINEVCPCKRIKLCSFYLKMETYLVSKGLLTNKRNYYKLIKDVKERKVVVNPLDIWKESFDANAALLVDHDLAVSCFDSLYRQDPKLYSDSRNIILDFILDDPERSIDNSILYRASSNIDLNEGNHFALQQYLWAKILQMDAIRLNEQYK